MNFTTQSVERNSVTPIDPADRDALDRVLVAIALTEPPLLVSAAADYPVHLLGDRDLRLVAAAVQASGPPDWQSADAIVERACDRLARHPAALALALRLREVGARLPRLPHLLDRVVGALTGTSSPAERESVAVLARLYFARTPDEEVTLLARLQQSTQAA